jgi:ubiquinone/menaquinone biosynthesis C-methylase UbiE
MTALAEPGSANGERRFPTEQRPAGVDAALRCLRCHAGLDAAPGSCRVCGRAYPVEDGVWRACDELIGKNRVTAAFYDGPGFQRFRPYEFLWLRWFGGMVGARKQILRHVQVPQFGSILEVGIGDGENVPLLPSSLRIAGVDIAPRLLRTCRQRFPDRELFLAWAQGEDLPFRDGAFDAALCVGGFNYFSDPGRALAEMARVVRPGGCIVVADELPDLHRHGLGYLLGWPRLDTWLMENVWFGPEFTAMVMANRLDVAAVAGQALGDHQIVPIWRGYGYCIVGSPP